MERQREMARETDSYRDREQTEKRKEKPATVCRRDDSDRARDICIFGSHVAPAENLLLCPIYVHTE